MKMQQLYLFLSLAALAIGIFFFAYQHKIIIINIPSASLPSDRAPIAQKTAVSLFYWYHNQWHTKQIFFFFSQNQSDVLSLLINRWLSLLHTEKIVKKKSCVQAALLSYDGKTIFISFDRAPWNKESSTYEKWMQVEGLLKTIKSAFATIKKVAFLSHHQPLQDPHLDFTNPWPIDGFLDSQ